MLNVKRTENKVLVVNLINNRTEKQIVRCFSQTMHQIKLVEKSPKNRVEFMAHTPLHSKVVSTSIIKGNFCNMNPIKILIRKTLHVSSQPPTRWNAKNTLWSHLPTYLKTISYLYQSPFLGPLLGQYLIFIKWH